MRRESEKLTGEEVVNIHITWAITIMIMVIAICVAVGTTICYGGK